ncbi:hypothetical protein KEJ49_01080 [Candidatus Bathyarchaeota archaeon]|nr:hypothetical protein [Candidatus Bathyarchaeota archaeon]
MGERYIYYYEDLTVHRLEILWEYVISSATIFCLIVTVGALLNGRITRREISRLMKSSHHEGQFIPKRVRSSVWLLVWLLGYKFKGKGDP